MDKIYKIQWTKKQIWEGCILASIAHAIMVAHYPELSNEHSWDDMNYSVQDSEGARGTITFDDESYVAVFRDFNSERLDDKSNTIEYKEYFNGISDRVLQLAEQEALQYVLEKINGNIVPLITSAVWGDNTNSFSNDSFDDMISNGAFLLERQTMKTEDAFDSWKEYYDMSDQQLHLLKSIFQRKIQQPDKGFKLSLEEIAMIQSEDEEGLEESKNSFSEIGIEFEGYVNL